MEIQKFIHKLFNLRPEEGPKFNLLFLHSFFLGIYISVSFVPANSVFVHHFGSDKLPLAYIVSGIAGYLVTFVYSQVQKRLNSRTLFVGALAFITLISIASRVALPFVEEKWLSFFVFVWAWPFGALITTETGGLALRLLNLRQIKRLFGPISIGGVFSAVLGYIAIPMIMPFLSHVYDLLLIAALGPVAAIVMIYIIYKRFPNKPPKEKSEQEAAAPVVKTTFSQLFKEKYFVLLFSSAMLSMIVIYFSDFAYLAGIKEQSGKLFSNQKELSNFIAYVAAAFKIGELLLSYFSSRILSTYSIRLGLVALPFISTSLIALAVVSGVALGEGHIVFFSFMVLNKIGERVLRRGLDDPSFNILYQPLPDEQKLSVQTKVGVIQQVSTGIAGVLLLIISLLLRTGDSINLLYFTFFFLPILVLWSLVVRRLYNAYREKLREILADKDRKKEFEPVSDMYGTEFLIRKLETDNVDELKMCVTILSETNPQLLEKHNPKLLKTNNVTIKKAILRNIDPTFDRTLYETVNEIASNEKSEYISKLATQAKKHLDHKPVQQLGSTEEVDKLFRTGTPDDKHTVIKYLSSNQTQLDESYLSALLEDEEHNIKQAAIRLAGKKTSQAIRAKLINLLYAPEYYHLISDVLIKAGDKIVDDLNRTFREAKETKILVKLAEILGKIGTPPAQQVLISHLNYPNKDVQVAVIHALYYSRFQADERQQDIIKQKIKNVIANIIWLFACINDIVSEKNTLKLIQALDLDREANLELLFKLLTFIYNPATIDLIKKNIIGENTIFALEIVENFITQDLKQLLIPLFDDISLSQRIKKLQHLFPQQKLRFAERLKDIIVKDYHMADVWTKAKAIELVGKLHRRKKSNQIKAAADSETDENITLWTEARVNEMLVKIRKSEMPDEIFVCLYHPDELIYSTASKVIYDENPLRCFDYLKKMSPEKQELIEVLEGKSDTAQNLLIDRVKILKRLAVFFSVPENILVKLAEILRAQKLKKKSVIKLAEEHPNDVIIVSRGSLVYETPDGETLSFKKNDIIIQGLNLPPNATEIQAKRDGLVLYGNRYSYFNLILDETEIMEHMFEQINEKILIS